MAEKMEGKTKIHVRRPGIEPGSQEWESCMIPLHQRRPLSFGNNFTVLLVNHNPSLFPANFLVRVTLNLFQISPRVKATARLAQSVEHETLNLRVVGSSPTLGAIFFQTQSTIHLTYVGDGYFHHSRHPGAVA